MDKILYPLTNAQRLIGFAGQRIPGTAVNNIGGTLLIEDELDFDLLKAALHKCIERNESLRIRIVNTDEDANAIEQYFLLNTVRQYVHDGVDGEFELVDFTGKTMEEMEQRILEWNRVPIFRYNSQLYEFKMIKAPDGRCGIFSKLDHMITDAWTSALLCKDIIEVYYALKRGEELPRRVRSRRSLLAEPV